MFNPNDSFAYIFAESSLQGLAAGYAIPIAVSMLSSRRAVSTARFKFPAALGWTLNALAVAWIAFQMVLFSMPTALPVTATSMNYASVVLVGFMALSVGYYVICARKGESKCVGVKSPVHGKES